MPESRASGEGQESSLASSTTDSRLSVVPNPNNGTFMIAGTVPGVESIKQVTVEVVDLLGKTIYSDVAAIANGAINKNITLGGNIPNGVYLIKLKNEKVNEVIRFTLDR